MHAAALLTLASLGLVQALTMSPPGTSSITIDNSSPALTTDPGAPTVDYFSSGGFFDPQLTSSVPSTTESSVPGGTTTAPDSINTDSVTEQSSSSIASVPADPATASDLSTAVTGSADVRGTASISGSASMTSSGSVSQSKASASASSGTSSAPAAGSSSAGSGAGAISASVAAVVGSVVAALLL